MRFDRPFEQYVVGERFKTQGRTVTEADIVHFAGVSGDFFPLHVDAQYAKTTRFGERIAHGMLTLSLATGLYILSPDYVIAFYGLDHVRFLKPVKIGDTIYLKGEVIELKDRGVAGLISVRQHVMCDDEIVSSSIIHMLVNKEKATNQ